MVIDVIKVVLPALTAFFIGIALTPTLTHFLYTKRAWKKSGGKVALDGTTAVEFNKLHKQTDQGTPRMGGIIIWVSVIVTAITFWLAALIASDPTTTKLDFISRNQTWIPLAVLLIGALVGLINDIHDIRGRVEGMRLRQRLLIVGSVASLVGWWFFAKLDVSSVAIPFNGPWELGWFVIPFFVLVTLALYASGVIDGIDGLSGGVFASIFSAYAVIAYFQDQINLAAFCATIVGAILAFLWFNIPPARFYMTETGTMGLTLTLAVVAFMTDSLGDGIGIFALSIIAFPLVITVVSNVLQVIWKKFFGRKLFRIAPIHHHFEAIGWPGYKVTMRFWILSVVCALIGTIIALLG